MSVRLPVARERGSMTLWVLGLCVCVLFLGGLSLDLWRILAVRRDLVAGAEAAATAGANGLDESSLRAGQALLDPELVEGLVRDLLVRRPVGAAVVSVEVVDRRSVVVTLETEVELGFLDLFAGDEPVLVRARAEAEPRRRP